MVNRRYPDNWNQYLRHGDKIVSISKGNTRQKNQVIVVEDYIPEDGPDAIAYMWNDINSPQLIRSKHVKDSFIPLKIKLLDQIHYSIW